MECYVGVDVHSKASVFVIQDGCGQVMAQGELATTPEGFRRQRRLDQPTDWVRIELETALKRDILVIPLLFGDVNLPAEAELSSEMGAFCQPSRKKALHRAYLPRER